MMDVESLAKELILKNMTPEQQIAVLDSVKASVAQAKEVQKRKIGENVDLVVQALKKIESDIRSRYDDVGNAIEKRVASIKDGRDGADGRDGRDGKDGKNGRDGAKGDKGERGQDGRDGINGVDGVSVTNARIDFDGSLVITLSTGVELNVGEVVAPDLAESIKVISNGGGTSQYVLDTLSSLQTQINNLGNGLLYKGTWNASSNTPTLTSSSGTNGNYYIVSVAGSTNLNGITDWKVGDWAIYNGTAWQKIDQTETLQTITSTDGSVTVTTTGSTANLSVANTGVTSVTGTSPVASSGGATPAISLASGYGDTQNPYASKTANYVLAAPNGSAGVPTFRAIVAADIPTLNQNTTGSAATLTTARAIYGNNFNGSSALTQIIASTYGGTGNGFTKFSGPTTTERTFTLPDSNATLLYSGGPLGTPSSGTVTNLTGTASININGTVGATTPASGSFTSLTDSGNLTFTGTGNRITGDFTNATAASRTLFQTSTTNGISTVGNIPNGTATQSGYISYNSSDPDNAQYVTILQNATEASIRTSYAGTPVSGTFLPLTFYTGGGEKMRIDSSGNVGIGTAGTASSLLHLASTNATAYNGAATDGQLTAGATQLIAATAGANTNVSQIVFQSRAGQPYNRIVSSGGTAPFMAFATNNAEAMRITSTGSVQVVTAANLGYGTGAGGTVTQGTSRTTGVTLSKPTGAITMFSAAGSTTAATFTVTNTLVAATDTIILNQKSGTNLYVFLVTAVAAGSFNITFYTTGGTATDAPVINFAIIKGATS